MTTVSTIPSIRTEQDLRAWIKRDYGNGGWGTRLAAVLGVSIHTECTIRRGENVHSLVKVAASFGYRKSEPGSCRYPGAKPPQPTHVGYRRADLVEHKPAILSALSDDRNQSIAQAAKLSGFSYGIVRRILDEAIRAQKDARRVAILTGRGLVRKYQSRLCAAGLAV